MIYACQMTVGSVIPMADGNVWEVTAVETPRPNIVRLTLWHTELEKRVIQDFGIYCEMTEMQLIMETKFQ